MLHWYIAMRMIVRPPLPKPASMPVQRMLPRMAYIGSSSAPSPPLGKK